jgi:hypothetical protein
MQVEERLQKIKHLRHLCEDQHPVAPGLQPPQENVQLLQLPAIVLQQPPVREEQLPPHNSRTQLATMGEKLLHTHTHREMSASVSPEYQ